MTKRIISLILKEEDFKYLTLLEIHYFINYRL